MSEFTPGPWKVHPIQKLAVRHPKYECWIPQCEADARLIAAAPELYEAAMESFKAILDLAAFGVLAEQRVKDLIEELRSALDKADGKKARSE
jgi:hypothetical protein